MEKSSEESSSDYSLELVVDRTKNEDVANENLVDKNIYEFDLDAIKDKPWLKPGADITDYFNYGFTEKTWKKYCEMQRENRAFVEREKAEQDQTETRQQQWDYSKRRKTDEWDDPDNGKYSRYSKRY